MMESKKNIILYTSVVMFIILSIVGITIKAKMDEVKLYERGINKNACVIAKYDYISHERINTYHQYAIRFSLLVDADETEIIPNRYTKYSVVSKETKMQEKYVTVALPVKKLSYEKYFVGDTVTIVYFKNKLNKARILDEIK